MEHGPGIYLTTEYATARKYAKGGGVTLRFSLDPDLGWLEDAPLLPVAQVVAWVAAQPKLPARAAVLAGVAKVSGRLGGDFLPADSLVAIMVNHDAMPGAVGPSLAAFLVGLGIDASHVQANAREDWVIVFNPRKILKVERLSAQDVPTTAWSAPRVTRRPRERG